jgi:nicotinamidase-related amidase
MGSAKKPEQTRFLARRTDPASKVQRGEGGKDRDNDGQCHKAKIVSATHVYGETAKVPATIPYLEEALGRKKLIMAGVTIDVRLMFPVQQALAAGYEVYAVYDASGFGIR